jgi:hypothetical protein
MTIDTSQAGQQIAAQMEAIEKDFEDKEGYRLGAIVTIVGIDGPEGSHFRIRHNLGNPALALGVMRLAEDQWIRFMREGSPPAE